MAALGEKDTLRSLAGIALAHSSFSGLVVLALADLAMSVMICFLLAHASTHAEPLSDLNQSRRCEKQHHDVQHIDHVHLALEAFGSERVLV